MSQARKGYSVEAANIPELEQLLLPQGCHFAEDAKAVIDFWESTNVLACPGSGKTTVLMAKLQHLADRMPLAQGRGICILSHTNVAVDEIKKRLTGDAAANILGYPNFAGTIQSFVDSFIVFPFLRSRVRSPIRMVSREEFAKAAWDKIGTIKSYAGLKAFINKLYARSRKWCESEIKLIAGLYFDEQQNLCLKKDIVATAIKPSAKGFASLRRHMLGFDGLMHYGSAYEYADTILRKHGDLLRSTISCRFQFVFIDEYQDCSDAQRSLFAKLFDGTDTVVQRIGDVDQAIYNSFNSEMASEWNTSGHCLEIAETNRYGEEIARIVSKLRTAQKTIISQRGQQNRKPVLFVYHEGAEKQIIKAFIEKIRRENLDPHGVFKAIGMVAKGKGTTISDYWNFFADDALPSAQDGWGYYRQEIVQQLDAGRLYKVTQAIEELIVQVARCRNMRTENNGFYTKTHVRKMIAEKVDDQFRGGILEIVAGHVSEPNETEHHLLSLLCSLCRDIFGGEWTEEELARELSVASCSESRPLPLPFSCPDGITVNLRTIHGVKGETHDATLYLETEHKGSSDLKRIMPLLLGNALPDKEIMERTRRCVYVGMSRPRHLLCVAMKAKTYEGHEGAFAKDWEIIHVRQEHDVVSCGKISCGGTI